MAKHRERGNRLRKTKAETVNERVAKHNGPVILVNSAGLSELAVLPPLRDYVWQLRQRSSFIWEEAKSKALRTTRDYRLWQLWLLINPVLDVALYGFLFGVLFKTSRGVENFVGFLIIGVMFMRILSGLVNSGSGLIQSSKSTIRAFSFPRASLVLSQTVRASIDNLLPATVGIVLGFLTQIGNYPSASVLLVVPLYLLIHLFGCGLMFIVARLSAEIPEVKALVGVGTSAWFFLSGVMFTIDRFDHVPVIRDVMVHNPAYIFLNAVRDVTIYRTVPDLNTWLTLLLWSFGAFIIGFIYFWRAEDKYVRLA